MESSAVIELTENYSKALKINRNLIESNKEKEKLIEDIKNKFDKEKVELKNIINDLKINLSKYTSGYGFIPPEKLTERKARCSKLKMLSISDYGQSEWIWLLSGIIRNNNVSYNKEPNYIIWCMSVIKSLIEYFLKNGNKPVFKEIQINLILGMVNEELIKNGKRLEVNKENIFLEIKNLLAEYYTQIELLNQTPKVESRYISTGENQGSWSDCNINTEKCQRFLQESQGKMNLIKKYLNQIYDKLESSLFEVQNPEEVKIEKKDIKAKTKSEKELMMEEFYKKQEEEIGRNN